MCSGWCKSDGEGVGVGVGGIFQYGQYLQCPATQPFDPAVTRERTRERIAVLLRGGVVTSGHARVNGQ